MKKILILSVLAILAVFTFSSSANACNYTHSRLGFIGYASGNYAYTTGNQMLGFVSGEYIYNGYSPVAVIIGNTVTGLYDSALSGLTLPTYFQSYSGEIIYVSGCSSDQAALASLFVPGLNSLRRQMAYRTRRPLLP